MQTHKYSCYRIRLRRHVSRDEQETRFDSMHEVNLIDDWLEGTRNLVSGSRDKGPGAVIGRNETCHDVKADLIRSSLRTSGFYKRWRYFNRRRVGSLRLLNFFGIIFDLWNLVVTNSVIFPWIFLFSNFRNRNG